ncbi:hypothetical protein [Viridibacterium curvum]|uniref:Phosphoglycerate mutase n=1 Tax=Viridibacterium curvum TaxID=1101404 RepID=A0ABP9QCQ2_9RHOO
MHARFVIPGLIWPATGVDALLADLPLPGLARLCARLDARHDAPRAFDDWLCREWGLASPPFAALRLIADGCVAGDAIEVCADPVNLRFAREHLLLDSPENLQLLDEELTSLCDGLNATFSDIGQFHIVASKLYLRLAPAHADKLDVRLSPLAEVVARPVAHFQPQGTQARWWSKLNNELQVFCHNHPVNQPREAEGRPLLNALWLWGAGKAPSGLIAPASTLTGDYWLLKGLAQSAGMALTPLKPTTPASWNLIDTLLLPAQQRDGWAWRTELARLDAEIFCVLADQLDSGGLSSVEVLAPGDSALTIWQLRHNPRWRFWARQCKPAALQSLLSRPVSEAA